MQNPSRIRARRPFVRLQVLQYTLTEHEGLSEWVPFSEGDKNTTERQPLGNPPHEPQRVFGRPTKRAEAATAPEGTDEGTDRIYLGEIISGERLFRCHESANVIHVGLQVKLLGRKQAEDPTASEVNAIQSSNTATCFVIKPKPSHGSDPVSPDRL